MHLTQETPGVTELHPVEESYVPVIKMKFHDISIDLLYASTHLTLVPEDLNINTKAALRHADPTSVRSLNGCRVTDTILLEIAVSIHSLMFARWCSMTPHAGPHNSIQSQLYCGTPRIAGTLGHLCFHIITFVQLLRSVSVHWSRLWAL
jgi:hypothetical protein